MTPPDLSRVPPTRFASLPRMLDQLAEPPRATAAEIEPVVPLERWPQATAHWSLRRADGFVAPTASSEVLFRATPLAVDPAHPTVWPRHGWMRLGAPALAKLEQWCDELRRRLRDA